LVTSSIILEQKGKGIQEGRAIDLLYFKAFYSNVSSAAWWAKTSPGINPAIEITRAIPFSTWPDHGPLHSKTQRKPRKSYQC